MRAEAKIAILQRRVDELEDLLRRATYVLPLDSLIEKDVTKALGFERTPPRCPVTEGGGWRCSDRTGKPHEHFVADDEVEP